MSHPMAPRIVYLDHAATSWPKPAEVQREMLLALSGLTANAGRSGHEPSIEAARLVFRTREQMAALLGAGRAEDVIFLRGCTEGLNLVLKGRLQPGDWVAVSPMEHNAVMRPLTRLVRDRRIVVETLPADPWGRIDLEAARRRGHTEGRLALVAVAHASNVNGVVQDLAGLRDVFPEVPILVDAAQTAGVLPIRVREQGISFLACSAHKGLLGPTGVGVCYLDSRYPVQPLMEGGTGSRSESFDQPDFRPDCYEAGTLNLHGIAGLYGALQGLAARGLLGDEKRRRCQELVEGLRLLPSVRVHSPADATALCVSFTVAGLSPDRVAVRLEAECGVLCRPGLQCAPMAHRHLGTFPQGTVRLSPGWGTCDEDVEAVLRGVRRIVAG